MWISPIVKIHTTEQGLLLHIILDASSTDILWKSKLEQSSRRQPLNFSLNLLLGSCRMANYRNIDQGDIALALLSFGGNHNLCSDDEEDDDSAGVDCFR